MYVDFNLFVDLDEMYYCIGSFFSKTIFKGIYTTFLVPSNDSNFISSFII